ncbi:MAG TPA: type II toxin-antitoxin system PemK/MazF family toxin, partial [Thermoanaerobaculia bacterium]|nr:type II toxin-antitoxin system PemK/MazF family toxin [Thermoanaerobaculia bacterium]
MAQRLNRGEIWLLDRPQPDRRRPVLVISRSSLLDVLHTVTVAAITSTMRGTTTEVELGQEAGL